MTTFRQSLGSWGENLAADFLLGQGYTILERNARTPYGELDLVTWQEASAGGARPGARGRVVVFVEVKTRRSFAFGFPEEAITPRKRMHLLAAAQAYLQAHPELEGDWRVDVIAIQRLRGQQKPMITHFENAVT